MTKRKFGFLTVILFVLTGCSASQSDPNPSKPVLIHAASSTQDALKEVAAAFQEQVLPGNGNKGSKKFDSPVRINSAGSNTLATQILAGAPGDLFLSANKKWSNEVRKQIKVSRSALLLSNSLVLIAPNSYQTDEIDPAANVSFWQDKTLAIAGRDVPAGQYARQVLKKLHLLNNLKQNRQMVQGQNVRHVLSYTESAEVDFGIVYHTDAVISDQVKVIHRFDSSAHDPILYEIQLLHDRKENETADQFYQFLFSDTASRIFRKHGFQSLSTQEKSAPSPSSNKGKN